MSVSYSFYTNLFSLHTTFRMISFIKPMLLPHNKSMLLFMYPLIEWIARCKLSFYILKWKMRNASFFVICLQNENYFSYNLSCYVDTNYYACWFLLKEWLLCFQNEILWVWFVSNTYLYNQCVNVLSFRCIDLM